MKGDLFMSIFKNSNEKVYKDGRKHFTDVIKNTGDGNLLIWKQPEEDFNTNSTLIVNQGEEAIFIANGKIVKIFSYGDYKLTTKNYPFISRLKNAFSGGVSTFNCKVYFVRTADTKEIKWGTDVPVQCRDPKLGIETALSAHGAYRLRIEKSELFLQKMIGNNVESFKEESVVSYFKNEFMMYFNSLIVQFIANSGAEILGICAHQMEIAILIEPFINSAFERYGIRLVNFSIASLSIAGNDSNRKLLEKAYASRGEIATLGADWARVKQAEIYKAMAENSGSGSIASAGAGIGMGIASMGGFSHIAKELFQSSESDAVTEKSEPKAASVEKLKELKTLLDLSLITEDDYNKAKNEILKNLTM